MSAKPIFLATHPRACSTAFERVFMTRSDLECIHEPFGDAFYYGPERLSSRFEDDEQARLDSGFNNTTYQAVVDRLDEENAKEKRLFIKDIIHYLLPPNGSPPSIAPTLARKKRGVGTSQPAANGASLEGNGAGTPYPYPTEVEPGNPTVVPSEVLGRFHFTFLIRHPSSSIPSYFRCTVPPLDRVTGFHKFMPSEAGYDELRRFFDYLRSNGQIGPKVATHEEQSRDTELKNYVGNGVSDPKYAIDICVVDADDLLDNPAGIIQAYCDSVGLIYDPSMLQWNTEADHQQAVEAFEKWTGFHEDAIKSTGLVPRSHKKKLRSKEQEDAEWTDTFGPEGSNIIREAVDANLKDYAHLKQFALKA